MRRMIATLFVATLVVACSSDDSGSRSGSGSTTTSTAEPARAPVRVVTLNLLHGLFCPAETDACPWDAYWVRVDAPPGPVDFLTTHFASSVNNPPCTPDLCPPICPSGITTNHCHAVEVADLFERRAPGAVISIVCGDLNATPGSPTVETLTEAGFRDA